MTDERKIDQVVDEFIRSNTMDRLLHCRRSGGLDVMYMMLEIVGY